jgi:pimeloyl-ACP methyl ester carboxylesterase
MNTIDQGPSVEISGDGPPVLLVHGLGSTGNVWFAQTQILSRYFKVIRPDLPGSGRSPLPAGLTTASIVAALHELIGRQGLSSVHLVGHSYGSIVCQHFARRHPECIRSLGLIGAFRAPADPVRRALRDRAATARNEGMAGIADATVQMGTAAETKAARPAVAGFVRELVMRQDPAGYAATCEALAATEAADLDGVKVASCVLTGDEDATSPPPIGRQLATEIPGAQFHLIARCGHWTPVEQPLEVNRLLLDFLLAAEAARA